MKKSVRGFGSGWKKCRTSSYWVCGYTKDDEDVPFFVIQKTIEYVPGQDVEKLLLRHCHSLMMEEPAVWDIIVHQGPDSIPQSGDQVVARLCREPFDQCTLMEA